MKRELTLDEIEGQDAKAPIWVINSSADNARTRGITGEVVLLIPIPDANPEELVLPATWLPMNLTDRVPRRHLLATPVLRRYHAAKLIKFVTAEYARRLLSTDGADDERLQIERREASLAEAGTAKTLADTPVSALVGDAARNINPITAAAMMAQGSLGAPGNNAKPDARRKVAPEIPDYDEEAPTNVQTASRLKPAAISAASMPTAGALKARLSEPFKTWVVGIEQKEDLQVLNGLRTNGRNFIRADLQYLIMSGSLTGKPKTLAAVQKALSNSSKG